MPVLIVNRGYPQVFLETNRDGQIVPIEKAKTFRICVRSELHTDQGELAFHTIVRVDKGDACEQSEAQRLAIAWLKDELPRRFSQSSYWNFFEFSQLDLGKVLPGTVDECLRESSNEVELSSRIATIYYEAHLHLSRVRPQFNDSAERLRQLVSENTPIDFACTLGEARILIRTIEMTLAASADLPGDQAGEARFALINYQELAKRKVESNHNYQSALTSLRRFSYGLSFPRSWQRRPEI